MNRISSSAAKAKEFTRFRKLQTITDDELMSAVPEFEKKKICLLIKARSLKNFQVSMAGLSCGFLKSDKIEAHALDGYVLEAP